MEVTTKKQNRRKIVIGVLIAVVVLVAAVIAFASSYLVNYAIGRSGDGGDREVALDVEAPTDGVEQLKSRPMRNFCSRIPARRCRSRQRTACG